VDEATLRTSPEERIIVRHHTTPEQAGEIFSRVQPRLALYSHIGRRDVDSAKLRREGRRIVGWKAAKTEVEHSESCILRGKQRSAGLCNQVFYMGGHEVGLRSSGSSPTSGGPE
jgi:hypothetical protein